MRGRTSPNLSKPSQSIAFIKSVVVPQKNLTLAGCFNVDKKYENGKTVSVRWTLEFE